MNIKELMSISGRPGLHRLVATKQSGVIAESLETGQKKFFSARSHQFSPLESIAIYTYTDALPLDEVFTKMKNNPPPDNLAKDDMRDYFTEVLPDHDQTRVYASDIKKIVAWFTYLDVNGYLESESGGESESEGESERGGESESGGEVEDESEDVDEVESERGDSSSAKATADKEHEDGKSKQE